MQEISDIDWMIQRSKIIDIIVGVANAIDDKNWQKLRSHLATDDYFEFRGEPPRRYYRRRIYSVYCSSEVQIKIDMCLFLRIRD
jgi:hypothetical protein